MVETKVEREGEEVHGGGRGWRHSDPPAVAAAGWLRIGNTRSRQGESAVSAAGTAAARGSAVAAAKAVVGLLPRSSLSSHLRGRTLLSFFN